LLDSEILVYDAKKETKNAMHIYQLKVQSFS